MLLVPVLASAGAGCSSASPAAAKTALPDGGRADSSAPREAAIEPRRDAVPEAGFTLPPHCDPGPEGYIPEAAIYIGGSTWWASDATALAPRGCSPDSLFCTQEVSFTPTTRQVYPGKPDTIDFAASVDGGVAHATILLDTNRFSTDDLVGVPVRVQTWMKFLDCFSLSTPQIQGEPLGSTVKVLRYADGRIIGATGGPVLAPGGVVVYGEDLLPEIKLRWVSTPDEDCEYRRVAFEITTVATGEKVLAHWERRAH